MSGTVKESERGNHNSKIFMIALPLFRSGSGGAEGSPLAVRSPRGSPPLSPSASVISSIPLSQCGILPQPGPAPARRGPREPLPPAQRQLQGKTHQVHLSHTSQPATAFLSRNPALCLQIFTLLPLRFFHLGPILVALSIFLVGMKVKRH